MNAFESIPDVSRRDLELAAQQYFEQLRADAEQPIAFSDYEFHQGVDFSVEECKKRIADLDMQLLTGAYDTVITGQAEQVVACLGSTGSVSSSDLPFVHSLAARAEREKLSFLVQRLISPAKQYTPYDSLFDFLSAGLKPTDHISAPPPVDDISLARLEEQFVNMKRRLGRTKTQIEDTVRVLRWLSESLGDDRSASSISKVELRQFRDNLIRLPKAGRGQSSPFLERLTDQEEDQVSSATAQRYWGFVQAFFRWAASEGLISAAPVADVKMQTRRDDENRSPEIFAQEELEKFLRSPLYQGHARARYATPGPLKPRDGHWWSGLVLMHTGMRGGELAQLEFEDFVFADPIPHLRISRSGRAGKNAKTLKNNNSIRRVPLSPTLIKLGLEEFVLSRQKRDRVFYEFNFGEGRKSDGISKFWQRYLVSIGLWKPGRATHVWRHTLVANLRRAGVPDEDIAPIVGHAGRTMTSTYGGEYPLERTVQSIQKLDFGFDVIAVVNCDHTIDT